MISRSVWRGFSEVSADWSMDWIRRSVSRSRWRRSVRIGLLLNSNRPLLPGRSPVSHQICTDCTLASTDQLR
jgi:hypothetical protein